MMSVFKEHITAMSAYSPPLEGRDPQSHLLLDFNERTLPIGPTIEQALIHYIQSGRIQTYPSYGDIEKNIAQYCGVNDSQVMITNGSDQGIDLIIRSACGDGDEAIIPKPSFAIYKQFALVENVKVLEPSMDKNKGFPIDDVLNGITHKTRLICLANPNNPSGTLVAREDIIAVLDAAPQAAVLVDECYFEYAKASVCDLVGSYSNLVITRTFSKTWGIPSLRLGYIVSDKHNIRTLLNVRGPYDVNQLAVVAVQAALQHPDCMQVYVDEVMNVSKPLFESWLDKNNVEYWPSAANFIWVFPSAAKQWRDTLIDSNILVRPKKDLVGRQGLRITLGDKAQTERLIKVLDSL